MIEYSLYTLLIFIANYIMYCVACYIDKRYELGVAREAGGKPDPMNLAQIVCFGFLPFIGITLITILVCLYSFCVLLYKYLKLEIVYGFLSKAFSTHKRLAEIGEIKAKQDKDIDYQIEKHILTKK